MEIRIVLQEKYGHYHSGKELIVTARKYKLMVMEGVKMRTMSPERLQANLSKVETADVDDEGVETAIKPKSKGGKRSKKPKVSTSPPKKEPR